MDSKNSPIATGTSVAASAPEATATPEATARATTAFFKATKVKKLGVGFSFVHKGLLYKVPARAVLDSVLFEMFRLKAIDKPWPAPLGKLITVSHATENATAAFTAALDAALK